MNSKELKNEIKNNIKELINNNEFEIAEVLISEYENIDSKDVEDVEDVEFINMKSILNIIKGKIDKAINLLKYAVKIDNKSFDSFYNLAYCYKENGNMLESVHFYEISFKLCDNDDMKEQIINEINKIKENNKEVFIVKKKKMIFFDNGDDSFILDIIKELSIIYEVKKVTVKNTADIDKGMEWADICWFEWCDELVIYGSNHKLAKKRKLICRLHSYEAFTEYPGRVKWTYIDKVIFIAKHIKDHVLSKIYIEDYKIEVVANGIDLDKFTYKDRNLGFNIAYVGYINYKKGPMLLLQAFKAIYDTDSRYKLYIAGQFQDERDVLYYNQMIKELGIEENVFYEGWRDNLNEWLENKNYILCTSILESQNVSVMQAMSKGIKPLIHNFVGAKNIYNEEYIWNSIEDVRRMIGCKAYNSNEYRSFIEKKYSSNKQIECIKEVVNCIFKAKELQDKPLVTIGVTTYNSERYISKCIDSILKQTYKNIEIIIVDDGSTDNTKKILEEYALINSNISIIINEYNTGGPISGINQIIDNSNGDYYMWFASDDFLSNNIIEEGIEKLLNSDFDYVYFNFNIVDNKNQIIDKWKYDQVKPDIIEYIFKTQSTPIPFNGIMKKEFVYKNNLSWIKYKGNEYSCDTISLMLFLKNGLKAYHLDKELFNYRIHENNESHNIKNRILGQISIIEFIIENFEVERYIDSSEFTSRDKKYYFALIRLYEIVKNMDMNKFPRHIKVELHNLSDVNKKINQTMKKFISKCKEVDESETKSIEFIQKYIDNRK